MTKGCANAFTDFYPTINCFCKKASCCDLNRVRNLQKSNAKPMVLTTSVMPIPTSKRKTEVNSQSPLEVEPLVESVHGGNVVQELCPVFDTGGP